MKAILNQGNNGHPHTLEGDFTHEIIPINSINIEVLTNDSYQSLEVGEKGAILRHDEHGTIALPKGKYFVSNQIEINPVTGRSYSVID